MNYKPFVSSFIDDSAYPVFYEKIVDKDKVTTFVKVKTRPESPYKGIKASSFSLQSQLDAGVTLTPAPALANYLHTLDGIDYATSMVDKIQSQSKTN